MYKQKRGGHRFYGFASMTNESPIRTSNEEGTPHEEKKRRFIHSK